MQFTKISITLILIASCALAQEEKESHALEKRRVMDANEHRLELVKREERLRELFVREAGILKLLKPHVNELFKRDNLQNIFKVIANFFKKSDLAKDLLRKFIDVLNLPELIKDVDGVEKVLDKAKAGLKSAQNGVNFLKTTGFI